MSVYTGELVAALTDAGYPAPHTPDKDPNVLAWSSDGTVPHIHVDDTGRVRVHTAARLDAEFTLGPQRQSAADWVALLHPHLAARVAAATGTAIAEPASAVQRSAALVWLEPDFDSHGTYAVYTDNARIRVSDKIGVETATDLFGTALGHQLGVTPSALSPMQSARLGTVMINADLAYASAVQGSGMWRPAISFRDTRGFMERATIRFGGREKPAQPSVPDARFRDYHAPTIELAAGGSNTRSTFADASTVAFVVLRNARRRHLADSHHVSGR